MKSQFKEVSKLATSKTRYISTAFPELAKEWVASVDRPGITPEETTHGARLLVQWSCNDCSFSWQARVYSRTIKGRGCPQCAKTKRGSHTRALLSESHPEVAKQFVRSISIENRKIEQISAGSDVICEWLCSNNHSYTARVRAITSKNYACPRCVVVGSSSQERNLLKATLGQLRLKYEEKPYKVPNFKYSVDYFNSKHKFIIQFDSQYYHSSDEKIQSDIRNSETLSKLGYKVIRVREGNLKIITPLDVKIPKGMSVVESSKIVSQHIKTIIKG